MIFLFDPFLRNRLKTNNYLLCSKIRYKLLIFSTIALFNIYSTPCSGQSSQSLIIKQRVEKALREQAFKSGAAGIAFGMCHDSEAILECYVGYASWEDKTPLNQDNIFNWASLSKGLTAVCALKLAEDGLIDLDSPIDVYVPECKLQITLHDILTHQSGMGSYSAYPELLELKLVDRKSLTQELILSKITNKKLAFETGKHIGYSSPGYILLSIALERASNKPYSQLVKEIVAEPLKLSSLGVCGSTVIPYRLEDGIRQRIDIGTNDWRLGAGSISSNLPDALTFAAALMKSTLISPDSSKELFKTRAFVLHGDEKVGLTYGFLRAGKGNNSTISTSGLQPGATALLTFFPQQRIASVIFANTTPLDLSSIHLKAIAAATAK